MDAYDLLTTPQYTTLTAKITVSFDEWGAITGNSDNEIYSVWSANRIMKDGWSAVAWSDGAIVGDDLTALVSRLRDRGVQYAIWDLDNIDSGDRRDAMRSAMTAALTATGITVL